MSRHGERILVLEGPDTSLRVALPDFANLTIGRAADDAIRAPLGATRLRLFVDQDVALELVSGRAERLVAGGRTLATPERLEPGPPIELALGDHVRVEGCELTVHAVEEAAPAPRLLARSSFRAELARRSGGALGLLRFTPAPPRDLEVSLAPALHAGDVFTALADGRALVHLAEHTPAEADRWAARLAAALRREGVELAAAFGAALDVDEAPAALADRLVSPASADGGGGLDTFDDPELLRVVALLERVAQGAGHVLLLGETGTGKDRAAQLVHDRSPRAAGPFVKVSGLELSDALEGRQPGALLERARGGTLYLDELLGLSPRAQLAFGHLLDEGLGSGHDVRVVASSNQDLREAVRVGTLRKDLLFRLDQASVHLPPLRARARTILPLARALLEQLATRANRPTPRLSEGAAGRLEHHPWPGNVRELRNVLERALMLVTGEVLGVEHLPPGLGLDDTLEAQLPSGAQVAGAHAASAPASVAALDAPRGEGGAPVSLRDELAQLEKRRILEALKRYPTQREAAEALEMPMRTFLNRLDALGIPRARGGGKKRDGEDDEA
jgi:transcriptional regulator with AAA-type ATPase domain